MTTVNFETHGHRRADAVFCGSTRFGRERGRIPVLAQISPKDCREHEESQRYLGIRHRRPCSHRHAECLAKSGRRLPSSASIVLLCILAVRGLLWANNMVAAGTPAELADRSEVREAYFG